MIFTTSIIHRSSETSRRPLIEAVRAHLPNARLNFAFEPHWEEKQDTRAIRGASVSHLKSYQTASQGVPHLVLEDDVVVNPAGLAALASLEQLPPDCGVLLVGSETPNTYRVGRLHEVVAPFHGAHGVLYNHPVLETTHFLLHAYEMLSTTEMSDATSCYEGLLDAALRRSGLRIYRMDLMAFSTAESLSSRTGLVFRPRSLNPLGPAQEDAIPYWKGTSP